MANRKYGIFFRKVETGLKGYKREIRRALDTEMRNTLGRFGDTLQKDFESTVQTWNNQPDFEYLREAKGGVYTVSVSTDDRIYRFINNGTRIRYATMTRDFMPKTAPGQIPAQPGRGGLDYVNVFRPHEGIKPRAFDDQILEKNRRGFAIRFGQALSRWYKPFAI